MILSVLVRYLHKSLVTYGAPADAVTSNSEQLIEDFGLSDSKAIRAPLVATLALSYEPLTEHEILTLLVMRGLVADSSEGTVLIRNGLSALVSMLHTSLIEMARKVIRCSTSHSRTTCLRQERWQGKL
jgi:hypothetical protein